MAKTARPSDRRPRDPSRTPGGQSTDAAGEIGPIVSSAHLADGALPALSEVEFGLNLVGAAFERWMVRCMTAAGEPGLTATEVNVLHSVFHRGKPKRLADICLVLGIEDTHLVTYAVRKLEARGLVAREKTGNERLVAATERGETVCLRYRAMREKILVDGVGETGIPPEAMSRIAHLLRVLSGHYDQAARTAASL